MGPRKLGHKPEFLWEEAVVKWVNESQKRSLKNNLVIFRYLDQFFSGMKLTDLTRKKVGRVISDKISHASAGHVNRITTLIQAILRKAEREWGWIDKAPAIRRLKEEGKRIRWLTGVEAERLFCELPEHLEAMARFSLATGLRESNVTGLEWSQVDLQRKVAWIHPDQAKTKKAIGIPLNNDAIRVIRLQLEQHHSHVFTYKANPVKKQVVQPGRKLSIGLALKISAGMIYVILGQVGIFNQEHHSTVCKNWVAGVIMRWF